METIHFDTDMTLMYISAESFPDGILKAHQNLHAIVPFSTDRKYFGFSRPKNGGIVYRAAASELVKGEAQKYECDAMLLKKGRYASVTIKDYMKDVESISRTFEKLLTHSELDPTGYCLEWYFNEKDVRCMVRLSD